MTILGASELNNELLLPASFKLLLSRFVLGDSWKEFVIIRPSPDKAKSDVMAIAVLDNPCSS